MLVGSMVSVNTHGTPMPDISEDNTEADSPKTSQVSSVELELKAVKYFQDKLLKKGAKLPIKSLAGHLSQAPTDMRSMVGPQAEFRSFLVKHKDIFALSDDDMVTLTDDILNKPRNQAMLNRSGSESSLESSTTASKSISKDTSSRSKPSPITMTASEYKTMKFVKELIETNDGRVSLTEIKMKIPNAADSVKNIIGDSDHKIIDFANKFPNIFVYDDNMVMLKKTRLNVIMAGSKPGGSSNAADSNSTSPSKQDTDSMTSSIASNLSDSMEKPSTSSLTSTPKSSAPTYRTLNNHKGPVYHLAKLWGIVDLGRHEHVFFDRSILPDGYDDLSKSFKISEILRFNAVRAARGSRARWRATHVWRDGEDIRSMYGAESTFSLTGFNSSGLDEEIKRLLPNIDANANLPNDQYAYVDASQSNTGCIPVWTVNNHAEAGDNKGVPSLSMVPESKYMQKSVSRDGKGLIPGYMLVPTKGNTNTSNKKNYTNGVTAATREVACQTISTGDIMATQLYQEDD